MLKSLHNKIEGTPEKDFITQNPEFQYLTEFKEIIDTYDDQSSQIFWGIYLMEHPNSLLYRIPRAERKIEIEKNYLKGTLPWEELKDFTTSFMRFALTKKEMQYKIMSDKMDDLSSYLNDLDFDVDSQASKAIDLMQKMDKIWKAYSIAESQVVEETQKGIIRGGGGRSFREKREETKV